MREMILALGWPFINILPNCVNGFWNEKSNDLKGPMNKNLKSVHFKSLGNGKFLLQIQLVI